MVIVQATTAAAGAALQNSGTTLFSAFRGNAVYETTEANVKSRLRTAATINNMEVIVLNNSLTAASTLTSRVNGAPGTMSISISNGATGTFSDTTNSDVITSGNDYNYQLVTGGATGSIRTPIIGANFNSAPTFLALNGGMETGTVAAGATTNMVLGGTATKTGSESRTQFIFRVAGTLSFLTTVVGANSTTAASTFLLRKNTANGNLSVSISNGATGTFEDTTNSDSIVSGDVANYQITVGGATGSLTTNVVQVLWNPSSNDGYPLIGGNVNPSTFGSATTSFWVLGGDTSPNTNENRTSLTVLGYSTLIKNLFIRIFSNSLDGATSVFSRRNSANGNLSVSISNGATGTFEDTTNSDKLTKNDTYNLGLSSAGTTGTAIATVLSTTFYPFAIVEKDSVHVYDGPIRKVIYNILTSAAVRIADTTKKTTSKILKEILRIVDSLALESKIHFIQSKTASGSGTSMTVTLPNTPIKSNALILTVGIDSALLQTVSSITSAGATWQLAVASINGVVDNEIWYASDLQSSPGAVITINFSGITTETHATAREYNGLEDINMLDKVIDNSGSSASPDTGTTATTTSATELWVGSTTTLSATNQSAPTNNFTLTDGVTGTLISNAFLEKFAVATGQAHSSTTADNVAWAGAAATFKAPTVLEIVITEILRIVERLVTKPKAIIRMFDAVRINDFISRKNTKLFTDMVRIRDLASRRTTKVFTDVVRIKDFVRRSFPRTFADALRVTDRTIKTTTKIITDMIRIRDYLARRTFTKTFSDAIRVTDRVAKTVTKVLLDIVRIVDRATATLVSGIKQIIVTDMLRIVDYARRTTTKPLLDMVPIADTKTLVKSIIRRFTDTIAIQDRLARTTTKPLRDMVRVADATAKSVTKRFLDIVRITDTTTFVKSLTRTFTDALRVVDRTAKTTSKTLRDVVRIRESFSRVITFTRTFTDPLRIADRTAKSITKVLSHIVRIADVARLTHTLFVAVTDMLRIVDAATKTVSKRLTDMLRIRETIITTKSKFLLITDTLRVAERVTKTFTKPLADAVRIAESIIVNRVGHVFTIIITDVVRVIGVPIGSIVTIIHQGAAVVVEAAKSIGMALENALHPGSKRKGSLGEADS